VRALGLALALTLAAPACGGARTHEDTTDPASREVTHALARAVGLIKARRLDAAERLLAEHRAAAAGDPRLLEQVDYYIATVLLYRGDLERAQRLLGAHASSAAARGDGDSQAWMESSLTWVRWGAGDLSGALAANQRLAQVATSGEGVEPGERRAWLLHHLWDRAFLLLEQGLAGPEAERGAAISLAREARAEHEGLARSDARDARQALDAWFAWRLGDLPAAARAVAEIDLDEDVDARDLFVVSIVADATEQRPRAERARARLGGMVNLLVPLLIRARPGQEPRSLSGESPPS
jgi:hypothetical protein